MSKQSLEMLNELMTMEDGNLIIEHGLGGFRGEFVDGDDVLIRTKGTCSLQDVLSKLETEALNYLVEMTWIESRQDRDGAARVGVE
jgi:hypothetical protein